ncbi:MAG: FGGY-family carbohydrate kinase [Defluviitaleaceae bacterium]|nr:FGGY-family carbohydrate kinase [Defluviitaleaceae bacterium]
MEKRKLFLGIEFGSTRIKAVLIDDDCNPVASGGFDWENRFEDGVWTYHLDDVWAGAQASYKSLSEDYGARYGEPLEHICGISVSAMMHGYLPFDKDDNQLAEFRTWRNTSTEKATVILTEKFGFNIPQRWSVAHVCQAILDERQHVKDIAFMTTLAGYVHYKLTGERVLGVGDASGMFPIDSATNDYDARILGEFDGLVADRGFDWKLADILPRVLAAGENAGALTAEGAKLLDASGALKPGIPLCPPEGDAGTGMVATNSVAERAGNVSAGTSIFAMIVLERALSKVYPEIDMVTTPTGKPVAMVHCNNCSSDLDAWIGLFREAHELMGADTGKAEMYNALFNKALEGDADCGGLLSYNYLSGEHTTGFEEGRPLVARTAGSRLNLANFMRVLLCSSVATLRLGMDILTEKENVRLDILLGHGGLFKTKGVGQRILAAALNVPVAVMESAGDGGAWGGALLAAYLDQRAEYKTLEDFLSRKVFSNSKGSRIEPDAEDVRGFNTFMERYVQGFKIEHAAVSYLR